MTNPRDAREAHRALLVQEWAQGGIGEPAAPASRLTVEDWDDLRTNVDLPVCAATIVAARTSDPDTASRSDYAVTEAAALDVVLACDPDQLTRPHRTLVVTAAMQITFKDGHAVNHAPDLMDEKRGAAAKHILDWTTVTGRL